MVPFENHVAVRGAESRQLPAPRHTSGEMHGAGHCLWSPVLPGDEDFLTLTRSVSRGHIIRRLVPSRLKNEIAVDYWFCFVSIRLSVRLIGFLVNFSSL